MSPRRLVALMVAALTLLVIGASWSAAHAQRDTTICTSFRTITTATGAVRSTSVAKVSCGVVRVDTVWQQPPSPYVPLDPRGYNCWMARDATNPTCIDSTQVKVLSQTLVLRRYGQTFGYAQWMWKGVLYPTDPALPAPGQVVHDTVTVIRHDTITVVRVDTVKVPVVTPPGPSSTTPELPRGTAAMDSMLAEGARAAAVTSFRDTLYTATAADGLPEERCKGLDCSTPSMIQILKDYTAELRARIASGAFVPPGAKAAKPKAMKVPRKFVPPKKEPVG